MSMHPSLKATEKGKKQRSVLKRIERVKSLMDKEKWKEGDDFYHLPKLKAIKIKVKKEKVEKTAEAGATEAAAAPATGKAAPAGKATPAAPAK
ncbi:MAG: small basic protein [Candidatus Omnitrophota bacterium]